MISAYYFLKDGLERIKNLEKTFKKQIDNPKEDFKTELMITNVKEAFVDVQNALLEYECCDMYGISQQVEMLLILIQTYQYNTLVNSNTVEEYYNALKSFNEALKKNFGEIDYENYKLSGELSNYHYDYMRENYIGENFFEWFTKNIKIPDRNFKVLNMNTLIGLDGYVFKQLLKDYENVDLYGVDIKQKIDNDYKESYKRLIYGDLRGSTISNEVFDICFYRTDFSIKREFINGTIKKEEKTLLNKALQYIRKGGYLVLDIPEFKLSKDICLILAKNFNDFYFVTNKCNYRSDLKDIIIIAKKNEEKSLINLDIYNSIRYKKNRREYYIDYSVNAPNLEQQLTFPKTEVDVLQFRGSKIDADELDNLYYASSCTKDFWNDQNELMNNNIEKRPLLPFNAGQIGLILTSGFLDGVVHEDDTHCHVVKGRTVQRTDSNDEIYSEVNSMEVTEITSNRVEINTFLPDGTFKKLA